MCAKNRQMMAMLFFVLVSAHIHVPSCACWHIIAITNIHIQQQSTSSYATFSDIDTTLYNHESI